MKAESNASFVREAALGLGQGGQWQRIWDLRKFLVQVTGAKHLWHEGYVTAALMRGPFVLRRGMYRVESSSKFTRATSALKTTLL